MSTSDRHARARARQHWPGTLHRDGRGTAPRYETPGAGMLAVFTLSGWPQEGERCWPKGSDIPGRLIRPGDDEEG